MGNINDELAKLPAYQNAKCALCGVSINDARLNIEGSIHHNAPIVCLEIKACNRRRKKPDPRITAHTSNDRESEPL